VNIAFLGLGRMGSGMARNLIDAGHDVAVYNRTRNKTEGFSKVAPSPAEAARAAEAVCTMLADDSALEDVAAALLDSMRPGSLHVSHSTVGTSLIRRLAAAHAERGQRFISAPVFGRPDAAAAKQLLIVAAGASEAVAAARPIFDAIGRHTVIAGAEPYQANAVKLCGNFMIASMIETFGEAYATIRKSGVEPHKFLEAMTGLFRSPVYENYGKIIAEERFEPAGFALRLGLKDAKLALAAAEEVGAPMPFASIVRDHLIAALANGQAEKDWSSFSKIAARNAGL
jgi:3-hydroxyisobutyrate dehydrogenase-like beta-hydroxyacid dehydrogenase